MCREIKQHSKTFILRRFFQAAFLFGEMEEWVMAFHKPEQIAELVIEAGVQKVRQTLPAMLIGLFRRSVYCDRFFT